MTERPDDETGDRLRTPPAERFAGASHTFDLGEVARRLRSEDHPARHGHRQMTIFQRGPISHVLFAFDAGGRLAEHSAPGLVTIQVIEGRLQVAADGHDHVLGSGQVLVLDTRVRHDVRASEPSVMLLTVHIERAER